MSAHKNDTKVRTFMLAHYKRETTINRSAPFDQNYRIEARISEKVSVISVENLGNLKESFGDICGEFRESQRGSFGAISLEVSVPL